MPNAPERSVRKIIVGINAAILLLAILGDAAQAVRGGGLIFGAVALLTFSNLAISFITAILHAILRRPVLGQISVACLLSAGLVLLFGFPACLLTFKM